MYQRGQQVFKKTEKLHQEMEKMNNDMGKLAGLFQRLANTKRKTCTIKKTRPTTTAKNQVQQKPIVEKNPVENSVEKTETLTTVRVAPIHQCNKKKSPTKKTPRAVILQQLLQNSLTPPRDINQRRSERLKDRNRRRIIRHHTMKNKLRRECLKD